MGYSGTFTAICRPSSRVKGMNSIFLITGSFRLWNYGTALRLRFGQLTMVDAVLPVSCFPCLFEAQKKRETLKKNENSGKLPGMPSDFLMFLCKRHPIKLSHA